MVVDIDKTMNFESRVRDYCDCDVDYYDLREHADDLEFIRKILHKIGIYTSHIMCYWLWMQHSYDYSAGWLVIHEPEIIYEAESLLKKEEK